MTRLVPMHPEAFAAFADDCIARYAEDNVLAGRWSADTAHDAARQEFDHLLPQGLQTPEHFVYEIENEVTGERVGALWFAVRHHAGEHFGYVYNIRIRPEFRGRGHAKAAIERIEAVALAKGLSRIALHVFVFNKGAQALYRSSHYGVTGMNMVKLLRRDEA